MSAGVIEIEETGSTGISCRDALARGLIYLPQDRRGEALALTRTIGENLSLEAVSLPAYGRLGFIRPDAVRSLIEGLVKRLVIRPPDAKALVQELSGGNQQKVVLGRALSRDRKIYVFDEPTAGVDVATRAEILPALAGPLRPGLGDPPHFVGSHGARPSVAPIYVMHVGRITAELSGADATEAVVLRFRPRTDPIRRLRRSLGGGGDGALGAGGANIRFKNLAGVVAIRSLAFCRC